MGAKVLLLEDDVALAGEMKTALAGAGCTVEIVRDGNAGLARAVSTRFDLIVASVELPGMNGFRLTNRLKKDHRILQPPIFLVSGQPSTTFDEHRNLPTRAESYFQKPIIMAELIARVRASVPGLAEDSNDGEPSEIESSADEWERVLDVLDDTATEGAVDTPLARIAAHEEAVAELRRELDEARANEARAVTARTETVVRLEREIGHWKERALTASSGGPAGPGTIAHDEIALRAQIVRKDAKLSRLTNELDQAAHANRELREKAARLEGDIPILKQALADLGRQNAEMEKLVSVARADKDQATRRALDLSRRLERVRPDIEQAERALAQEQAQRRAEAEDAARALAEAKAQREAEREETEGLHTGELAARDAAHGRKIREMLASHESSIRPLEREVAALRAQLENERNAAAQRELAHREEVLLESRTFRAEHIEALSVAERAFEHKQAVQRHEFEAAQAKLREQARQKIQDTEARLADGAREMGKRAAEVQARFEADLAQARQRAQALEQELVAEREARAEQLSEHADALAEASALRDRERMAAEERELALHEHLAATAAARAREHADELRRANEERESAVAALRQELAATEARRVAEAGAAEAALAASRAEHKDELDRLRIESEQARSSVEARYEERFSAVHAERDAAVQRAADAAEQQVRKTSERFSATERELRDASAALEERHRAEMAKLQRAHEELHDSLMTERKGRAVDAAVHSDRLAEVARASNAELARHLERYQAEQERKDAELRRLLGETYRRDIARVRDAYEARIRVLEHEGAQVRGLAKRELEVAEERWRAEKEAELRSRVADLEATHVRSLSEVESRASRALAAARQEGDEATREADKAARERIREIEAERDSRVNALEGAIAALERDRDRRAEVGRALEAAERALDVERTARTNELESHRGALAVLAGNHEAELGETRQRLRELETLHAATLEAREAAAAQALVDARADHDRIVVALQTQLEQARSDAERARAEYGALEKHAREEAEAKEHTTAASHGDALVAAERRFEARVSDLLGQQDEQLAASAQRYDLRIRELEAELEEKKREARDAALGKDRAAAEIASRSEQASKERELEMAAFRAEVEKQIAETARKHEMAITELTRAHEAALAAEGQHAKREAQKQAQAFFEEQIGRAMGDLRTELELERAQTFGQMERTHSAALRRVMENGERERAALSARVAELDGLLASRGAEPAPHGPVADGRASDMSTIERLEALVRSRVLDVVRLERELDLARAEVPSLEAEIAALRTELTTMRIELDDQSVQVRVSKDELEQERRRLDHAESALAAALARIDAADASNGS